jgi:hypothetical protein
VLLSWLGSFRSVRCECGAIEFDEVADPLNLDVWPLESEVPEDVEQTDCAEEPNAHHNRDGANPFPDRCDSPMFVDPFEARI